LPWGRWRQVPLGRSYTTSAHGQLPEVSIKLDVFIHEHQVSPLWHKARTLISDLFGLIQTTNDHVETVTFSARKLISNVLLAEQFGCIAFE
jgi:hypothetical protein